MFWCGNFFFLFFFVLTILVARAHIGIHPQPTSDCSFFESKSTVFFTADNAVDEILHAALRNARHRPLVLYAEQLEHAFGFVNSLRVQVVHQLFAIFFDTFRRKQSFSALRAANVTFCFKHLLRVGANADAPADDNAIAEFLFRKYQIKWDMVHKTKHRVHKSVVYPKLCDGARCFEWRRQFFAAPAVKRAEIEPHKVIVLSLHANNASDASAPEYVRLNFERMREFAVRQEYRVHLYQTTLDAQRHAAWSKLRAISNAFDDPFAPVEYALWLDSDVFVQHVDFALVQQVMSRVGDTIDLVLSRDPPLYKCASACSGVMIVRNTPRMRAFLRQWYDAGDTLLDGNLRHWHPWEQGALAHLVDEQSAQVAILPFCVLNSVCHEGQFNRDAPIIHCMTLPADEKVAFLADVNKCAECKSGKLFCQCCANGCLSQRVCQSRGFCEYECVIGPWCEKRNRKRVASPAQSLSVCQSACESNFGIIGSEHWCRCCALDCGGFQQACIEENDFVQVCGHAHHLPQPSAPLPALFDKINEPRENLQAIGPVVVLLQVPSAQAKALQARLQNQYGAMVHTCCHQLGTVEQVLRVLAFADFVVYYKTSQSAEFAFARLFFSTKQTKVIKFADDLQLPQHEEQ